MSRESAIHDHKTKGGGKLLKSHENLSQSSSGSLHTAHYLKLDVYFPFFPVTPHVRRLSTRGTAYRWSTLVLPSRARVIHRVLCHAQLRSLLSPTFDSCFSYIFLSRILSSRHILSLLTCCLELVRGCA